MQDDCDDLFLALKGWEAVLLHTRFCLNCFSMHENTKIAIIKVPSFSCQGRDFESLAVPVCLDCSAKELSTSLYENVLTALDSNLIDAFVVNQI